MNGAWRVVRGNFRARDKPRTTHHAPGLTQPQPALLTDIRSRAAYAEGAGIYRIVPAAVAVPRGVEELQELVRWAAATGTRLVPRGAGSGMAGGSVGGHEASSITRTPCGVKREWCVARGAW